MSFLTYIYRNGIWISIPLFVISTVLLAYFILNVIRVVKQAHLLSVPLLEQQEIEFAEAGRVVLCTQGPQLSFRFAKLDYELVGEGIPVEGRKVWPPKRTTGFLWIRLEVQSYRIPRPGRYILRIRGLESGGTGDSEHRIVFVKPHLAQRIGHVIGIVLAGMLFIGSIVLFFLRLLSRDGIP